MKNLEQLPKPIKGQPYPSDCEFKAIEELQRIFKGEHFTYTGSFAIQLMGIPINRQNGSDLDVIIRSPNEVTLETLNRMKFNDNTHGDTFFKVEVGSVKFDVFIQKNNTKVEPTINVNGLEVTTLPHIIKFKKSYNRAKDLIQLMQLRENLFGNLENLIPTCKIQNNYH